MKHKKGYTIPIITAAPSMSTESSKHLSKFQFYTAQEIPT